MKVLTLTGWSDYELIDSGNGRRLERYGKFVLSRPDPQAIWERKKDKSIWDKADAVFEKENKDKGHWESRNIVLEKWPITFGKLRFWVKLMPFKHTGVFPEQSLHWEWIEEMIKKRINNNNQGKAINILNLFGYTGIATLAAAQSGAKVTHVDASRSSIAYARENQLASNLQDRQIRWILDDALKFCQREQRRGVRYDGIIMDPPIYGHGPANEVWSFEESFPKLLKLCKQILSDKPLFIIINAYAITASALMLENMLEDMMLENGEIEVGELAIKESDSSRLISTGIYGRWMNVEK